MADIIATAVQGMQAEIVALRTRAETAERDNKALATALERDSREREALVHPYGGLGEKLRDDAVEAERAACEQAVEGVRGWDEFDGPMEAKEKCLAAIQARRKSAVHGAPLIRDKKDED